MYVCVCSRGKLIRCGFSVVISIIHYKLFALVYEKDRQIIKYTPRISIFDIAMALFSLRMTQYTTICLSYPQCLLYLPVYMLFVHVCMCLFSHIITEPMILQWWLANKSALTLPKHLLTTTLPVWYIWQNGNIRINIVNYDPKSL